jgi:glycerol-3-phosphate O-acyltransferase
VSDFLVKSGKSRYVPAIDEFDRARPWVDFLGGLLRMDLRVQLIIGKPLDPFGNDVDACGLSHDPRGRPVDPGRYLLAGGVIASDDARDAEYTRILAARIVASYRVDTVALPSAILAYAVLQLLRRRWPRLDIYRLLREIGPDTTISMTDVSEEVDEVLRELRVLEAKGSIRVSSEAHDAPSVVSLGLKTFGTYHATAVVTRTHEQIRVGDAKLLFFYQARLDGYGLRGMKPLFLPGSDS